VGTLQGRSDLHAVTGLIEAVPAPANSNPACPFPS
jgi:hypothetical protein